MDNNGRYIAAGILVAVILIGWWTNKKPNTQNTNSGNGLEMQQDSSTQENPVKVIESGEEKSNQTSETWEGTLKISDNLSKGNLMLVTGDHTVYLRTSRDFSALLNKEVKVSYQGTLESFKLGNIVAK